jgi:uncharacterized membrane protein
MLESPNFEGTTPPSLLEGTMDHYQQWLHLLIRWIHMITGIAWIGSSFYFNWLEGQLNRKGVKPGLAGDLWAIHGGGIYYLVKYQLAPDELPEKLHWFKWEAYFTWLSGMSLLVVVYYLNAHAFLIDPRIADLSSTAAISISLSSLLISWCAYHLLCSTSILFKPRILSAIIFSYFTALAYVLSLVLSTRAAYMHVGAAMGTIMALNVFFVIIPSQKQLVAKALAKQPFDATITKRAGLRSLHNNYFTLPVLFVMISNHFPMTYNHKDSWLVLAGIGLVGTLTRHFFNQRNKGFLNPWMLALALCGFVGLAIFTQPPAPATSAVSKHTEFSQVQKIIAKRCVLFAMIFCT